MAMQVLPAGSRLGFIPGSDVAGQELYGPQYKGMTGIMSPGQSGSLMEDLNYQAAQQDLLQKKKKFDLLNSLFNSGMSGSGGMHIPAMNVPAPNYVSAGPVWTQQQIDAQSNLQRGNLLTQANNNSRMFSHDMASRGFSPFSPFAMLNQQSNLMHANAGAAANETGLNFNSAQANSDARLKAAGINAGMYGDWTRNLVAGRQADMDYNLRSNAQHQDFVTQLLRSLA